MILLSFVIRGLSRGSGLTTSILDSRRAGVVRTSAGRRHAVWLLAAVMLLALVAGCRGGGGDDSKKDAATATGTAAAPATASAPATPTEARPAVARARVTTDDLNVRVGPGTSQPVLGRLQQNDEVPVAGRWDGGRWIAIPHVGWVAFDPDWLALTTPFEQLPQIPDIDLAIGGPPYPRDQKAGIPVVDEVVGAVLRADRNDLRSMIEVREAACSEITGSDQLTQCQGKPPETRVRVFSVSECQPGQLPEDRLPATLDRFFTSQRPGAPRDAALRLYAVTRAATGDPDPGYLVVMGFEGGEGRQLLLTPAGKVVSLGFGCKPTPPGQLIRITREEPYFWLRPPAPPPLRAS